MPFIRAWCIVYSRISLWNQEIKQHYFERTYTFGLVGWFGCVGPGFRDPVVGYLIFQWFSHLAQAGLSPLLSSSWNSKLHILYTQKNFHSSCYGIIPFHLELTWSVHFKEKYNILLVIVFFSILLDDMQAVFPYVGMYASNQATSFWA